MKRRKVFFTRLHARIKQFDYTYAEIGEFLGISQPAFSKKMHAITPFTEPEMQVLMNVLAADGEKMDYFWPRRII